MSEFENFEICLTEQEREEDQQEKEINPLIRTKDLDAFIKEWIEHFFADKDMYFGGPISKKGILSDRYINWMFNLYDRVPIAIEVAYCAMEIANGEPYVAKGGASEDIKWVVTFLHHCRDMRVPQGFVGGLMLIYLELCEGINVPNGIF